MAILIKRYANRKLYNTDTSRYITLKGIGELIDQGQEVRVIDNESGEDITKVALSQILVDSERSHSEPPGGLLSQIFERGGDALYGALRKSVDDSRENIEEISERVRKLVNRREDELGGEEGRSGRRFPEWVAFGAPDIDRAVQASVERTLEKLDFPTRSDLNALTKNLERVAEAVEALQRTARAEREGGSSSDEPGRS